MKKLSNLSDAQIRRQARRSYQEAPTHTLQSVVRMNNGTVVVEKQITLEVCRELLKERPERCTCPACLPRNP